MQCGESPPCQLVMVQFKALQFRKCFLVRFHIEGRWLWYILNRLSWKRLGPHTSYTLRDSTKGSTVGLHSMSDSSSSVRSTIFCSVTSKASSDDSSASQDPT